MPDRPDIDLSRPFAGGRPLKRWRWAGIFTDTVMVCVGSAWVGPAPTAWWAVWDRGTQTLMEHSIKRPLPVPEGVPGTPVETISPHGDGHPIWTRKTPTRFSGTMRAGGRELVFDDAAGFVDESAGYHARRTDWCWSAGVGTDAEGRDVAWNLVTGLHDADAASERTVWVGGTPHHVPAQTFAPDLSRVGDLAFTPEATRAHKENLLLVASDYEQPFGSFSGSLPHAGPVTGLGVMERHSARW